MLVFICTSSWSQIFEKCLKNTFFMHYIKSNIAFIQMMHLIKYCKLKSVGYLKYKYIWYVLPQLPVSILRIKVSNEPWTANIVLHLSRIGSLFSKVPLDLWACAVSWRSLSSDARFYSWTFTLLIHGLWRALKSPRPGSAASIPAGRVVMWSPACGFNTSDVWHTRRNISSLDLGQRGKFRDEWSTNAGVHYWQASFTE